jgi:uncharacterized protein YbjT (DUF2867 family)
MGKKFGCAAMFRLPPRADSGPQQRHEVWRQTRGHDDEHDQAGGGTGYSGIGNAGNGYYGIGLYAPGHCGIGDGGADAGAGLDGQDRSANLGAAASGGRAGAGGFALGRTPFDWEDRGTWAAALQGVERVYISYYPDLAVPGATDAVRALTELAAKSGVQRLVLLSGRGEIEAQLCEDIVRNSGLDFVLVRASWFNQNFSENFLVEAIRAGELALPVGNVGEPFIDTNDIADVAVAALTQDRHIGELYEVTGPRLLSFADAIGEIAHATGRSIRYVQISSEDYAAALAEASIPADFSSFLLYLFSEVLDGRNAYIANGVERALGRAPRDFSEFVRDTVGSGVWDV